MNTIEIPTCGICWKSFQNKASIIWHMLNVHKNEFIVQKLNHESGLNKLREKTGEDDNCDDNFVSLDERRRNKYKYRKKKKVRKYTKEFKCETCGYVTVHMSTFKRHIHCHSEGTKVHKCKYCSYAAIQPYNLKKHMKTVHPFGPVKDYLVEKEVCIWIEEE